STETIMETHRDCVSGGDNQAQVPCYEYWKDCGTDAVKTDTHCYVLSFTVQEKEKLAQMGVEEKEKGHWKLPDSREVLPKSLALRIMREFHGKTHWGTQALIDQFAVKYVCIGIYNIAKRIVSKCMTCQKVNK
ncbi:hypothetical protein FQV18_0016975, partial [Eudyptula minor novaehollandiae]